MTSGLVFRLALTVIKGNVSISLSAKRMCGHLTTGVCVCVCGGGASDHVWFVWSDFLTPSCDQNSAPFVKVVCQDTGGKFQGETTAPGNKTREEEEEEVETIPKASLTGSVLSFRINYR